MIVSGDEAASFTKEEMQQGKHTDYEKALHEEISSQSRLEPVDRGDDSSKRSKRAGGGGVNSGSRTSSPKEGWPNLNPSPPQPQPAQEE